jgi:alpha/beta superfamily hydrolase
MTEPVSIPGGDVTLEGRFLPGNAGPGVVITHPHPHPLFGGSMNNNVVWTAERAFHSLGWATLCFNFRGVNRSTGTYGGGEAEAADVAAALDYLQDRTPGPLYLVGYSFGAFVAGRALLKGLEPEGAVLISPPVAFMEMSWLPQVPRLKLIIAGDRDEIGPLIDLRAMLAATEPPVPIVVITGADHFFTGREEELFKALRNFPLLGY